MKDLPSQFDLIRSTYNTQKDEWSLDEMVAILVKEEDDINDNQNNSISLVANKKDKSKKIHLEKTYHHK